MQGVLAIDIITAALAISPLFFIKVPQPPRSDDTSAQVINLTSLFKDVRDGFSHLWAWKGLFMLIALGAFVNFLLIPAFTLIPLLVTKHFGGEAIQLAWMNSAEGMGTVAGGLLIGAWGGFRRRTATILLGLIGTGISTLAIGLTPSNYFWMGLISIFLAGFMDPIIYGPFSAIIQAKVAPDMQGRTLTIANSVVMAISPLSMLIAGPVADTIGIQFWYLLGGGLCLIMGIAGFFVPIFFNLEEHPLR